MKRRLVSKVFVGQDVCLFCAFRPGFNASVQRTSEPHHVRGYRSSSRWSYSANATATRQHEDSTNDESPMMKQNQNLARSFPVRQESTLPVRNHPFADVRRPGNNGGPRHTERNSISSDRTNSERPVRITFGTGPQRDNSSRQRFNQGYGIDRARPAQVNYRSRDSGKYNDHRNQHQPSFSPRNDSQQVQAVEQQEFRPFQPVQSHNETSSSRTERPNQSRPPTFRRVDPADRSLKNVVGQPLFRRVNPSNIQAPDEEPRPRYNGRDRVLGRGVDRRNDNALSGNRSQESVPSTAGSETSIGPLLDAPDAFDGFRHRRGGREDRRKSRSSRFEEEEEFAGADSPAQPLPTTNIAKGRGGGSLRARSFDYEAAEAEEALYGDSGRRKKKRKDKKMQKVEFVKPTIKIPEFMSVSQLANALGVQLELFIGKLEEEGFEGARYDNILDAQTSSMLADLYGYDAIMATVGLESDLVARPPPEDVSLLPPRPPIVTIMGHVDHGKTTILDYLRKSSVVATEHGGITQHIGAFSVMMPGTNRQITFLDTPGHAAFLEMRRRGANVTDIVVLVVAADDSVKPQTIEAIKHAKDAGVQIIVAINKVDKEDANIDRVKQDLTRHDIIVEDYGGDYQAIPVSGKTGQGMSDLEEAIITLADVYDYRAEQDGPAEGTIIESKVTAAGRVATVLVRRGILRPSDFIVAGNTWARVRTLRDDTGQLVTEAPPGTPVQVDGWRGEDPTAGLEVLQAENEEQAKQVIDLRNEQRESLRTSVDMTAINEARNQEADARAKVLAWEAEQECANKGHGRRPKDNAGWVEPEAADGPKQVHFIVKADVAGSVEAVVAAVGAVGNREISANVIHSGTGQVSESDIRMLATSGEIGYIISFNQSIDGTMYRLAEDAGLQILDHNIIYKVTDVVKEKLAEQLPPIITQRVLGEAEVGQIFEVTIKKNKVKIAGCKVTNGTISRTKKIRVLRGGAEQYTGKLHSSNQPGKD
ncbi:hypothetical protein R6Q59_010114 [Mikania micrantha]